jgi:hypothetical protein
MKRIPLHVYHLSKQSRFIAGVLEKDGRDS